MWCSNLVRGVRHAYDGRHYQCMNSDIADTDGTAHEKLVQHERQQSLERTPCVIERHPGDILEQPGKVVIVDDFQMEADVLGHDSARTGRI